MKTLIVILYNIRSTYNVGAILRSCDGLGVDKVLFAGYTPFLDKGLPHEQVKLKKQIHKTALGAEDSVTWGRSEDIRQTIAELKEQQYRIVALEQGEHSIQSGGGVFGRTKYRLNSRRRSSRHPTRDSLTVWCLVRDSNVWPKRVF